MIEKKEKAFKHACKEYLLSLSLGSLRAYGRDIGVARPAAKKKDVLIEDILAVLCEEMQPIERSKRGAPVRDDRVDPRIVQRVENIRRDYLYRIVNEENVNLDYSNTDACKRDIKGEYAYIKANKTQLVFNDPQKENTEINIYREVYRGQLETLDGVPRLLSLDCIEDEKTIIIPIEIIRKYTLCEGDIVSGYAEKSGSVFVITDVLTINEMALQDFRRTCFEECNACYSSSRIRLFDEKNASVAGKYLEWLSPLGKGQRACIVSSPKTGKTRLLIELADKINLLNPDVRVLVLLIDQPPENVGLYRRVVDAENLVYTTYEDESDKQIFAAKFMLKRAKRLAECGKDVLLIVDSLSALAKAYNETEESAGGKMLACGLESKTLHYIKKFFGTARCLEKNGSLAILGSIATDTGNPADDLICAELVALGNYEIRLSGVMATKRIYPALDLNGICAKQNESFRTEAEIDFEGLIRSVYLSEYGSFDLLEDVAKAENYTEFVANVKEKLKK